MDRHRYFRRASGVYYTCDKTTGEHSSLRTKDKSTAIRLTHGMNEAARAPLVSRALGKAYITGSDPKAATRTWQDVVEAYQVSDKNRGPVTLERLDRASKAPAIWPRHE